MSQQRQRQIEDKENVRSNAHSLDPIIGSVVSFTNTAKNMSQSSEGGNFNMIQNSDGGAASYAASSTDDEPLSPFGTIWECPGIIINTKDDFQGWRCKYCPRESDMGGYNFFKYRNATKALTHFTHKGRDIAKCRGYIPPNVRNALNVLLLRKQELSAESISRKSAAAQEIDDHQYRVLKTSLEAR